MSVTLLHGDEHKPEKWYLDCTCTHPDDDEANEQLSDADYKLLVDEFEDTHADLYDGDDYVGRGCEKSYTDTRCSTCSRTCPTA